MFRQPDQRNHLMTIHEAIPVQRTGDEEADVIENTRRFVKAIEDAVRAHPDQFLWVHRRFRTRPPGMAPVYDWEVRKRQSGRAVATRAAERA
jgi:KDO2-lipid IV(A) lauroyltransferase